MTSTKGPHAANRGEDTGNDMECILNVYFLSVLMMEDTTDFQPISTFKQMIPA